MELRVIWPGRSKQNAWRELEGFYERRIRQLVPFNLVESKVARGLRDRDAEKIKEIEARDLEKYFQNDYIICLFDKGREMKSEDFARFLEKQASSSSRRITFVVGGFAGLAERIMKRADFLLSLSRMTFSHELSRILLLEQVYRALTIWKGKRYAK